MTIAVSSLKKTGRFPALSVQVQRYTAPDNSYEAFKTSSFTNYRFSQSMLVPVDAFSFSFNPPTKPGSSGTPNMDELIKEGDVITVHHGEGEGESIMLTGIVDSIGLRTTNAGETFTITGRDLLGQLEDQDAITFDDGTGKPKTFWGEKSTISNVLRELTVQTRIDGDRARLQGMQSNSGLFATSPGESKLSALLRFLEPMNALVWIESDGTIVCGKPNFSSPATGQFFVSKAQGQSNCIYMQVNKNAGRIPNGVLGIWSGGEFAQQSFVTGVMQNPASRCSALRKVGHILNKTVVVSVPSGDIKADGAALNTLAAQGPNGYVQAYVKRLIARANIAEVDVEVLVPGHCNDGGVPYSADTVYHIFNDRAAVDEDMYCYAVDYLMDGGGGQSTSLHFCKLGTIVADAVAP